MGGRGARLGTYFWKGKQHKYGDEYKSVLQVSNIKYVVPVQGSVTAPMETMTKGRVYATVDQTRDIVKSITYYDSSNKRMKQIDINGVPHKIDGVPTIPHTHLGYIHDENGTRKPTPKEAKMIAKVVTIWQNKGKIGKK